MGEFNYRVKHDTLCNDYKDGGYLEKNFKSSVFMDKKTI